MSTPQRNLKLTGNAQATGGAYEDVKIIGEGTIDGDVECKRLRCVGNLDMDGNLQSGRASVVGNCSFSGDVQADTLNISGTVMIGGAAKIKELRCTGKLEAKRSIRSEQLKVSGQLTTEGDCAAEVFTGRGILEIGGLLNAGKLDIKLYRNCRVGEIGGGNIHVRKGNGLNPLNLFFRPLPTATLTAATIEGDEIYLENTTAKIVRGKRVTIGPGCDIEAVEYTEHFDLAHDATVAERRKV